MELQPRFGHDPRFQHGYEGREPGIDEAQDPAVIERDDFSEYTGRSQNSILATCRLNGKREHFNQVRDQNAAMNTQQLQQQRRGSLTVNWRERFCSLINDEFRSRYHQDRTLAMNTLSEETGFRIMWSLFGTEITHPHGRYWTKEEFESSRVPRLFSFFEATIKPSLMTRVTRDSSIDVSWDQAWRNSGPIRKCRFVPGVWNGLERNVPIVPKRANPCRFSISCKDFH